MSATEAKNHTASPTQPGGCCGGNEDADAKPHLLAASYYSVRDGLTATLMLNNKGPRPIEAQLSLFNKAGERQDIAPLVAEPLSFKEINLREFIAEGSSFEEGSLQVFHRGKDLVLGVQVKLVDERRSLIFDEKLAELATEFSSNELESVWWLPSRECETKSVLSNTTDNALTVELKVDGLLPQQNAPPVQVTLAPHETRVTEIAGDKLKKVGGVSLRHDGAAGALLARIFIQEAATGYSSWVRFADTQKAKSTKLHGAGLRLASIGEDKLDAIIVARNTGDEAATVKTRVPYTTNDGNASFVDLPRVRLAPNEARVINSAALKRIGDNIQSAGLEFDYTGQPGKILISAQSVSRSRTHVFQVPLWDIVAHRSSSGGYPWSIEGSSSTIVYIKNVTDTAQDYVMQFDYAGGVYAMGRTTVAPHQTTVIDVRALRDEQTPDTFGKTIPLDVSRGQVRWTMKGREDKVLIGRAEQTDFAKGISSSYACRFCCPNKFYDGFITPEEATLFVDESTQFTSWQRDIDCYGHIWSPFNVSYLTTWSSSDSEIADGGYQGWMTAYSSGTAMISGSWMADSFFADIGSERCDFDPVQALATAFLNILNRVDFTRATLGGTSSSFDGSPRPIANLSASRSGLSICGQFLPRFNVTVKFNLPSSATALSTTRSNADPFGDGDEEQLRVTGFSFNNVNLTSIPKSAEMVISVLARNTDSLAPPGNGILITVRGDDNTVAGFGGAATVRINCP